MTQQELEALVTSAAATADGGSGVVRFEFEGISMACLSDVRFDRVRIIAPVVDMSESSEDELQLLLEANFHTALDARYATSDGVIYAAFLHPLSPLSEPELQSALRQVASLVKTFGSTYSSGELVFGNAGEVH